MRCALTRPRAKSLPGLMPWFWRWAVVAGRGWVRTAPGWGCCHKKASPWRHCRRQIAASMWRTVGAGTSPVDLPASRSNLSPSVLPTPRANRLCAKASLSPLLPGSRAAWSMPPPACCAMKLQPWVKRRLCWTCAPICRPTGCWSRCRTRAVRARSPATSKAAWVWTASKAAFCMSCLARKTLRTRASWPPPSRLCPLPWRRRARWTRPSAVPAACNLAVWIRISCSTHCPAFFAPEKCSTGRHPPGGYLLSACLASGHRAGKGVVAYLAS